MHRDWADIFVVIKGEASLVSGGELSDVHTIAEGEQRGSGIRGGRTEKIGPGAVIHIGPGVAHQLCLTEGAFTYFVIKVRRSSD